jgi:GTP-binding protein Era
MMASDDAFIPPADAAPAHRSGFVAVVGRPNVGKSTLINRLVGQKVAIVSPKPQTTRNRLLGILTRDDAQVVFVDTPGIHTPLHRLGEAMVDVATAALPDADAVLWLVDVSVPPTDEDRQVAEVLDKVTRACPDGSTGSPRRLVEGWHGDKVTSPDVPGLNSGRSEADWPVILGLNKADLVKPERLQAHVAAYAALAPRAWWILISATRGDNLDDLLAKIVATLPLGPRYYPEDQFTDQQERFMAAELVREQVLRHLRDEVPHAVAVMVDEFKEREAPANVPGAPEAPGTSSGGMTYISAVIYVERETHKGILLGKGGQMLKQIGQGARQAIEELLGTRVYLELWAKVRPNWRTDDAELRRLGYQPPAGRARKGGGGRKSNRK